MQSAKPQRAILQCVRNPYHLRLVRVFAIVGTESGRFDTRSLTRSYTAKTLFEWLCEQQPGKYEASQVRTLQRRVAVWRALHLAKVASLAQVRSAGELMQTDGTWLNELGMTIDGRAFKHILIHSVLPYSNWE